MKLPARATICEVGTRDGFQIEPDFIPTELKVEVVDLLSDAGVPRIEVTSFVHPKVVPQLQGTRYILTGSGHFFSAERLRGIISFSYRPTTNARETN